MLRKRSPAVASVIGGSPRPGSAIDHLRRHDSAASLLPAVARVVELRRDVLALLPDALRGTCEVAGGTGSGTEHDGGILLHVSSAGAAAKLRQTLPRLRRGLLERGWQVTAIRIRVQPKDPTLDAGAAVPPGEAAIDDKGIDAFEKLERALDESPLKDAVRALLHRRR